MLEFAELGLFIFALWIPFRMGRAGIRNLWCILTGWFVLAGLMMTLAILPLIVGNRGGALDSELANAMPDGQAALPYLLFGWVLAWASTAFGKSRRRK
ncbi:MAG: hypothetical protein ABSE90_12635 [Verrucomicrobiota bacterium]